MAKAKHSDPWKGWRFWEGYLVDPDGNRYSPDMVKDAIQSQPEITIKWQGQEITLKLPSSSGG